MASLAETPSLSLRNGFRCVTEDNATVEDVLVAVGEQIGHENILSASRMNKAVVVFLKEQNLVNRLIVNGLVINGAFLQLSPLYAPSTKVTISNVPPFVADEVLQRELARFGKVVSPFKTISLGCKHPSLRHVVSFRRQVFMMLESNDNILDINFRVKHEGGSYMVYVTTGSVRCFECGDIGHKRLACPHKRTGAESAAGVDAPDNIEDLAEAIQDEVVPTVEVSVVNDEAVVSAENIESVPSVSNDVCADGDVAVNLEPGVSANTIVSDVKPDDAVPSTSANKKSEGVKDASQGECYDVIEEMEEVLSDDPELLEDSQCDDGNSQGTVLSSVRADFSGGFNKDSLYSLEEINSFLDETYGKQVNIK